MPNDINHVVVGNETKLDLRQDTVTPSTMVSGIVAHDASGARIVGTFDPSIFVQKSGDTMTGDLECPRVYKNYNAGEYYTEYDLSSVNGLGLRMYADSQSMYGAFCHQARLSSLQVFMSDGDGTNEHPITNSVTLGYDGICFENNNVITRLDDSDFIIADKDILRTHRSLVGGYGTRVTANKDLNTTEFLSVNRFFCPLDATVATLTNCPTGSAFMMDVFAPISATIDDESASSGTRYRVRVMMTWQGQLFVQYCYWSSSGWVYGAWKTMLNSYTTQITAGGITWTVTQYADGYADMYADITLNGTWQSWGGMYVLEPTATYALPITVTKKLEDVTTYRYTDGSANSALPTTYSPTSSENQTTCALLRPTVGNNNTNYYCRKYIKAKI